jgi:hypothetical protein
MAFPSGRLSLLYARFCTAEENYNGSNHCSWRSSNLISSWIFSMNCLSTLHVMIDPSYRILCYWSSLCRSELCLCKSARWNNVQSWKWYLSIPYWQFPCFELLNDVVCDHKTSTTWISQYAMHVTAMVSGLPLPLVTRCLILTATLNCYYQYAHHVTRTTQPQWRKV